MTTDVRYTGGAHTIVHVLPTPPPELRDIRGRGLDDGEPAPAMPGLDEVPAHGSLQALEASEDPLLATKLYRPPPRRDLVRRPRLTERLAAGLQGPVTLIVAPPGSGKTTVLADWCAAQQDGARSDPWPVAWLGLDPGDNDLARLLRYLIAALRPLRAEIGRTVLAGLRAHQQPDTLLIHLLNDLATLDRDVILVLDDLHVIDDPAIHRAFTFLLDHLPPRLHLVLATRADPPLPLARLRARGQLTELRTAELRFTLDEATAFLRQTMGVSLSADDTAMLQACTEGWIVGLQLAALALQGREPAQLREAITARMSTHRYILDYLADEVFARQPAEVQDFLLRTSILDRLSGPLCASLTVEVAHDHTEEDGQAMLERLEMANLFVVPLDSTRTWYRYHHLFAGFLRQRLRREQPALIPELHRRACRWHEQHGLLEESVDHALSARDYAPAARLIEQAIPAVLWRRGELATLLRWLEQVPRDAALLRPRLCIDLAWISLWSAQVDGVEPRLQDAEGALDASLHSAAPAEGPGTHRPGDIRALHGEIAAIRAELARRQGEIACAIDLARQALTDLPEEAQQVRAVTSGLLGSAYLSSGDIGSASQAFGAAIALGQASGSSTLALIAGGRLVWTHALQGQFQQAAAAYRQTCALADRYEMAATPWIGVAQAGMGEVLRERNDLATAEDLLRRGVAHCMDAGSALAEMALDGTLALAHLLQARGDTGDAFAMLERAEALAREGHVVQHAERVAVARARLWLMAPQADVTAAQRWAERHGPAWAADDRFGYVGLLDQVTLARLYLAQGRRAEAAALLRKLHARAEAGGLVGSSIEILVLQARLYQEQEQDVEAMVALSRALTLAEPAEYVRLFVDEGPPIVALLRQARARGVAPAYVARLLAACGAAETPAGTPAQRLIDPLSAREREIMGLLASGLSTTEIAGRLYVTAGTVRNHLKSIFGKLDAHSRLQAVERARALRLL